MAEIRYRLRHSDKWMFGVLAIMVFGIAALMILDDLELRKMNDQVDHLNADLDKIDKTMAENQKSMKKLGEIKFPILVTDADGGISSQLR